MVRQVASVDQPVSRPWR